MKYLALLLFGCVVLGAGRPNVVIIMTDDMGYSELKDLAKSQPERVQTMAAAWQHWAKSHNVLRPPKKTTRKKK